MQAVLNPQTFADLCHARAGLEAATDALSRAKTLFGLCEHRYHELAVSAGFDPTRGLMLVPETRMVCDGLPPSGARP